MAIMKYTKALADKFLQAYRDSEAILYPACERIGVHSETVETWIKLYPNFSKAKKEVEKSVISKVEHNLLAMTDKNVVASIFYLKKRSPNEWGDGPIQDSVPITLWFKPSAKNDMPKFDAPDVLNNGQDKPKND